jgi:hypothetical protein
LTGEYRQKLGASRTIGSSANIGTEEALGSRVARKIGGTDYDTLRLLFWQGEGSDFYFGCHLVY